jgi:hypothetical protein
MAKTNPARVPASIERVGELLVEASRLSNHKEFIVIGSLSVLASAMPAPKEMLMSIDVDFYPRLDPGRAGEIAMQLGPDSAFAAANGLYADAVNPHLAALPEGWEQRLHRVKHPEGVLGLYLDPNDCAVAKLARSERRDQTWVRQGVLAGIIDPAVVHARMKSAPFLDVKERDRAARNLIRQVELAQVQSKLADADKQLKR